MPKPPRTEVFPLRNGSHEKPKRGSKLRFVALAKYGEPSRCAVAVSEGSVVSLPVASVGTLAGLAEYTNGGYVSDDTIFRGFALPRRESLGPEVFDPPAGAPGAVAWCDWLAPHAGTALVSEPLPFDHPWYVLY